MRLSEILAQMHAEREAFERTLVQLHDVIGSTPQTSALEAASLATDPELAQRLEEYKFLRVELEAIWVQGYSTLNFMLAVVGLIVTAAYNTHGDPLVLLPMASVVTIGGYTLIRVHATRVWRIVAYMRCALEPNLKVIQWETRLTKRHDAIQKAKPPFPRNFDSNLFDVHILILNIVNMALILGIWGSVFGGSEIMRTINGLPLRLEVAAALSALPCLVLIWALLANRGWKRGGFAETEHFRSWNLDTDGPHGTKVKVYKA